MASYRLLRNNKETGPYSLEALVQLGLKPYDLVWEEGRSAAWRYPSEIQALKFFAPAVEEQPYDRFYKKPAELKKEEEKKEAERQQTFTPQVKLVNIKEVETAKSDENKDSKTVVEITTPKKQVFVSLPANLVKKTEQQPAAKTFAEPVKAYKEEAESNNSYQKHDYISPSYNDLVSDYNSYQPQEKKIPVPPQETITHKEAYPLETKYSQSLDDIKDIYAQTLVDRKKKTAQKKMIGKMLKRGLPFAAVLVIGFFLGSFLMNDKDNSNIAVQQQSVADTKKSEVAIDKPVLKQDPQTETTAEPVSKDPAATTQQQITIPEPSESKQINDGVVVSKLNAIQKYVDQQKTNNTATQADKPTKKQGDPVSFLNETNTAETSEAPRNIEADPKTGERNRIVRSTVETKENETANTANNKTASSKTSAVWKQVSVKSNDYKKGTFGGIHGLQLTVNNTSNFLLDKVVVELQYLKQNEEVLKTENIHFNMVPPNGSLILGIPPSLRGVKVAYRVINVESKAAGDTAGL